MAEMSNYGHAGTGIAEKTVTSTEKVGQLLTPYASSTLKDEENWVHENQKRIEKTLSVASLVTGDFYKTQAIQSYDRMDFKNMNNVTSEYLQNIGCHISNNESTFMINSSTEGLKSMKRSEFSAADLTSLRNTGSVTIKGTIYSVDDKDAFNKTMQNEYSKEAQNKSILSATSKDDKIRAMETIYHKGIENMKNSSNLSSIYDKQGNADAVKRECDRVARSMQNDMNNLANRSHDTRLQEYARRSQLSKADLSEINKSINANRNLSSKEKADLKELFKDKNELSGFINSGAIHGGDARRGASQQKYGSRIVTSQLLGQDMQTGIDIYRGVYKVTSLAVKSSFAFGHAISDTAANIGFAVSKPGTKLIDKTVTKITGTQNTTASNFLKNAQERRNVKRTRERSRMEARNRGRNDYKAWKAEDKQQKWNRKEDRFDNKINRNNDRITKTRQNKNSTLENRLNRKNAKLDAKKQRLLNRRERYSKKLKLKERFSNRANSITNKLLAPMKAIAKPMQVISAAFNAIKKILMKYIAIGVGIVILAITSLICTCCILLGLIALLDIDVPKKEIASTDQYHQVDGNWIEYHQQSYPKVAFSAGNRTISSSGCGLCATATVLTYYSGGDIERFNPASIVDDNENSSLIWTNLSASAIPYLINTKYADLGLTCTSSIYAPLNLDKLDKLLAQGGCAIVDYNSSIKHNGINVHTNEGHYIMIRGGNQVDGYQVIDSNVGHCTGTQGVSEWRPYYQHTFSKEYIVGTSYHYYITPPEGFKPNGKIDLENLSEDDFEYLDPNYKPPVIPSENAGYYVPKEKRGNKIGSFSITAYCSCSICCGEWSKYKKTASGTTPMPKRTIAVDPKVIPLGTKVVINGCLYVAEDTGGAIKGNRIDMYFNSHQEALNWGRKQIDVYYLKE